MLYEYFDPLTSFVCVFQLILWDTVGTERFRTLTRNYFRNAHACLLVFSSDEPDSLTSLSQWVGDADNFAENCEYIYYFMYHSFHFTLEAKV